MPYYELPPARATQSGAGSASAGAAIGALSAMLLAFFMVPLRDHVPNAAVALALVLPVMFGSVIGGRVAGIVSASIAALSFNFVFTKPYLSLRIASRDDVTTFVVLAIIGVVAAELGSYARRSRIDATRAGSELDRMYRVAELSSQGADVVDVIASARAELVGLFDLDDCVYEAQPSAATLPRLGHRGSLLGAPLVAIGHFVLPTGGVEVRVSGRGRPFGRLVLYASSATQAPLDKRLAAVTIAHELGATLASRAAV